ncbi:MULTISPECIES: hypothetical protein [unclassified Rhizobium]|uniref:hypothetical protein n=1 Tax=unclassified Rhizobium TaxID=2613769 RepID=UPI00288BC47B|nr:MULTISPECIES: hypothetical protein [unclassified Rhizobium]
MTKPAYTIGRDEMLLITVRWNDGDTVLLETPVRFYKAEEIQSLIDETVSEKCDVVGVDLYDFVAKKGQSIADDFDVRTWKERCADARREQAEDDEKAVSVAYNALRNKGTWNHAQQGIEVRP